MSQPTALIFGISGQDGAYLSHLLLSKGYQIVGVARDLAPERFGNLRRLGILDRVRLQVGDATDPDATLALFERTEPREIYDLAGQSSVAVSFERPKETFDSIAVRAFNILESLRLLRSPALAAAGRRHNATPAQIALAWSLRDGNTISIPKASSAAHLEENAAAASIRLTDEDLAEIDAAHKPPRSKKPLGML